MHGVNVVHDDELPRLARIIVHVCGRLGRFELPWRDYTDRHIRGKRN